MRKARWWFIFACRSSFTSLQRCVQTGSHPGAKRTCCCKGNKKQKIQNTEVCQNLEVTGHARKPSIGSQWWLHQEKALEDFKIECDDARLPLEWNHHQIHQFLIRIDEHYFSASDIKILWKLMHDISKKLKFAITHEEVTWYDFVLAWCKPTKDHKLPVMC